ncbi:MULTISPECIES: hypothetical protein [unclassified Pseudomonas]|uniref:hypothetical protein n=1 Tax=unclassified Pseudomonas TaxID=196821 RepID=UPI002E80788E|nr:hypothetical protein [Pseudomonas sp. 10C3]MEE3507675.1 hypothetical protein [Pseudomonas sp. 10C3]
MANLSPWMVESADRYLQAAKHLRRGHDMLDIAQINGQVNETYELDPGAIKLPMSI